VPFLQVLYMSGDGDPLWFSLGKGSSSSFDELIPTGAPLASPPHHLYSDVNTVDRSIGLQYTLSGSTQHYSRCSPPPPPSFPSLSVAQTSWYPAVREILPLLHILSPESYLLALAQSCRRQRTHPSAHSSASRSSCATRGGRPSRWAAWPSTRTRSITA
jgi:hypothetical protein